MSFRSALVDLYLAHSIAEVEPSEDLSTVLAAMRLEPPASYLPPLAAQEQEGLALPSLEIILASTVTV